MRFGVPERAQASPLPPPLRISESCTLLDPAADPRWDNFVENHPYGWIVHTSGWKQVLESSFPHMHGYYFAIIDPKTNQIRSALPVFEVRSWLLGKRFVSIPFATLCDPLASDSSDLQTLLSRVIRLFAEHRGRRIELCSFKSSLINGDARFSHSRYYKHHFIHLSENLDRIQKSFHRSNVRQRIQRALASKVTIRASDSEEDIATLFNLHMRTRQRHFLPPLPERFFRTIWRTFAPSGRVTLLLAEYNRQVIAALLLLKFKDRVSAEFLASEDAFFNLSPNHLLFWEAIRSAKAEGYSVFDFGRTSPSNETLMTFKSRWGTQVVDLGQSCYPPQTAESTPPEYWASYKLVQFLCRYSPKSALPLIGRICYGHLG